MRSPVAGCRSAMPRHVGQVPLTYRHHPTGGRSNWKVDYVDGRVTPPVAVRARALVHDLHHRVRSGSTAASSTPRATWSRSGSTSPTRAQRAGDEVVQLYVRDEEASVARPVIELRGFRRVHLEPGECRTVTFRLSTEELSYIGADYRRVVEPGRVRLFVGRSSADLPLSRGADARRPDGRARRPHLLRDRGERRPRGLTHRRPALRDGSPFDVAIARPPSIAFPGPCADAPLSGPTVRAGSGRSHQRARHRPPGPDRPRDRGGRQPDPPVRATSCAATRPCPSPPWFVTAPDDHAWPRGVQEEEPIHYAFGAAGA